MYSNVKHQEKYEYVLRDSTNYKNINSYIFMKDGFNIIDGNIYFDIENKRKYESLVNNFNCHIFRIKYQQYSRFFSLEDLSNEKNNDLLSYAISKVDIKEKDVYQKIPIDTKIYTIDGDTKLLENYLLKISIDNIVETAFLLSKNPSLELEKEYGKVIHYIKDTNTILFNTKNGYLDIKDVISKGLLKYCPEYNINISGNNNIIRDALIFNGNVVGNIISENKIFLNEFDSVSATIMGTEFDIGLGIFAILEKSEDILYYKDVDKIIGNLTYNEYQHGDIIFSKNDSLLQLVTKDGLIDINPKNIIYGYDSPDTDKSGTLWFDISLSAIRIFDGSIWKILSKPSLQTISKKIELDKKFNLNKNNYLEVYGFDSPDEFKTIEMVISSPIIYDVGFEVGDMFTDSVFVNGDEIDNFTDAVCGVHLDAPLLKGDLFQAIITKKKEYEWIDGHVIDNKSILLSYPFQIEHIKKLYINNIEYNINSVDQNRIFINDLIKSNNIDICLNICDKVKAKIKTSTKISNAYPDFKVEYKDNLTEIELPFDMKQNRFDNLMVTNNGIEVIMNPQITLKDDEIYAYYSALEPTKLKFSRALKPTDSILVQFIKHTDCDFKKESLFQNSITNKDISDKLILDSIVSFEDPTLTLNYVLQKLDENITVEPEVVDHIIGQVIVGGANVDIKTEDEKIQDIIDSVSKPSNPDISEGFLNNKPMPAPLPDKYKPLLARPSNTYLKPTINVITKNYNMYKKYNFEFTERYMEVRNELKKYLYGLNKHLSEVVSELTVTRDALRNMIHYLCNTLCLEEILKTVMAGFASLVDGVSRLGSLFKGDTLNKMKNLLGNLKDKLNKTLEELGGSIKDLIGLAKDSLIAAWGGAKEFISNMVGQAVDMFNDVSDKLKGAWDSIKSFFNKFKKTEIGDEVGNYKTSIWSKLKKQLSKVGDFMKNALNSLKKALGNLGSSLKNMWEKIKNFDYKSFFKSLTIEDIINYICNTLLKGILDALDDILEILRYLQKRFQSFLNKLFAENYRSPLNDLNYLTTMANFFKSHINICQILRELWADPGNYTLAKFLKRTSNLETIFNQWKYNKKVLKNMVKRYNLFNNGPSYNPGTITDLAGAGNALTNSILSMDELFGMNDKTIETIISNLKRAFTLNFKTTTGSILDKQAMTKQLFDVDRFKTLSSRIVPW